MSMSWWSSILRTAHSWGFSHIVIKTVQPDVLLKWVCLTRMLLAALANASKSHLHQGQSGKHRWALLWNSLSGLVSTPYLSTELFMLFAVNVNKVVCNGWLGTVSWRCKSLYNVPLCCKWILDPGHYSRPVLVCRGKNRETMCSFESR